ncbi:hypothetical protein CROQUDRAFT_665588 [Cronartium quercuum f. sp. fusiforme G11]|uniref:Uncharacterized protein n=1 Tax=Cronartium quercuum f. sp. fusiforme G11 TaxID=708437 RepID=A0A9P6N9Z6_9BASI|nr:hypothetical protein CROQUDRAFT_665588 [Cronartium quercuum f. sp. fusiforme G11]
MNKRRESIKRNSNNIPLYPNYVNSKQLERSRSIELNNRLSNISSNDQIEIIKLRTQINSLKFENNSLKDQLNHEMQNSKNLERDYQIERKKLLSIIKHLKDEVEEVWDKIIRLKESYEGFGASFRPTQTYKTEEVYERVGGSLQRSPPRVTFNEKIIEGPVRPHSSGPTIGLKPIISNHHQHHPHHHHRTPSLHEIPINFQRRSNLIDHQRKHSSGSSNIPLNLLFDSVLQTERHRRTSFS